MASRWVSDSRRNQARQGDRSPQLSGTVRPPGSDQSVCAQLNSGQQVSLTRLVFAPAPCARSQPRPCVKFRLPSSAQGARDPLCSSVPRKQSCSYAAWLDPGPRSPPPQMPRRVAIQLLIQWLSGEEAGRVTPERPDTTSQTSPPERTLLEDPLSGEGFVPLRIELPWCVGAKEKPGCGCPFLNRGARTP